MKSKIQKPDPENQTGNNGIICDLDETLSSDEVLSISGSKRDFVLEDNSNLLRPMALFTILE